MESAIKCTMRAVRRTQLQNVCCVCQTTKAPVWNDKHDIVMLYRAKNGFGAMNVGAYKGLVDNKTCKLLSAKEL